MTEAILASGIRRCCQILSNRNRDAGGLLYMKDPSGHASRYNDVLYTREQMEAWLVDAFENRYAICAAGEARL